MLDAISPQAKSRQAPRRRNPVCWADAEPCAFDRSVFRDELFSEALPRRHGHTEKYDTWTADTRPRARCGTWRGIYRGSDFGVTGKQYALDACREFGHLQTSRRCSLSARASSRKRSRAAPLWAFPPPPVPSSSPSLALWPLPRLPVLYQFWSPCSSFRSQTVCQLLLQKFALLIFDFVRARGCVVQLLVPLGDIGLSEECDRSRVLHFGQRLQGRRALALGALASRSNRLE